MEMVVVAPTHLPAQGLRRESAVLGIARAPGQRYLLAHGVAVARRRSLDHGRRRMVARVDANGVGRLPAAAVADGQGGGEGALAQIGVGRRRTASVRQSVPEVPVEAQ